MMFRHPPRTGGGAKALRILAIVLLTSAGLKAPAAEGPAAGHETAPRSDPNAAEASQAAAVPAADPQMVAGGQRMYKDYCQRCHGMNMVSPGGAFFDLRTFPPDQKPRFVNSVMHGKRAMPAWGGVLKPEEIDSLWAYVSSRSAAR